MGRYIMVIIGSEIGDQLDINNAEFDYYVSAKAENLKFPLLDKDYDPQTFVTNHPADLHVDKTCRSHKGNIDTESMIKDRHWPPEAILRGGDWYDSLAYPDWNREFNDIWNTVEPNEVVTLACFHR